VILAFVALLVGACAPASGPLGTPATPPATEIPSVDVPTDDATPDLASPFPSSAPTASPAASPDASGTPGAPSDEPTAAPTKTPKPTTASDDRTIVRAYFFLGSFTDNAGLAPVLRELPPTPAVATAAVQQLLRGPNDAETSARPAMYTDIPARTRLLGLSIHDHVATVNLSKEFESGGDRASIVGRLAQVVYTVTQFPTVELVEIEIDGQPVDTIGNAGIDLGHGVDRADFTSQLPAIFVDRPAWGAALGHPGRVSGMANVFEATFRVRLLDANGSTLVDRQVMATCGTGCWGSFKVELDYSVNRAQYGTLRVYDRSAKDGSPEHLTEYPVWLTPSR
jgi:spore germination protein GerM